MVGYSTELLIAFCVLIGTTVAKRWTTYSYTPKGAAYPLSKLRSCQSDAQNMMFCGARLINGTECELLMMGACDELGNGSGTFLHLRKTTVRREHPFFVMTVQPGLTIVSEYIPVNFEPGSEIKILVEPTIGWNSFYVVLYAASEWKYAVLVISNNTGCITIPDEGSLYTLQTLVPECALLTNQSSEIRIYCGTESLEVYVNETMCMQRSHVVPSQIIGRTDIYQFGVLLHSMQFDAAHIPNSD